MLKIKDTKYPDNFFIIEKNKFEEILKPTELSSLKDLEMKKYKIFVGKEGIFIFDSENERHKLYFLRDIKEKIEQIFIFNNESYLNQEFEQFRKIGRNEYFYLRKIRFQNYGHFNLIVDGKIIGKYFNLYKYGFQANELDNNINLKEILDSNETIIRMFLPNVMTCLSKFGEFQNYFNKKLKSSEENVNKKDDSLISVLLNFHLNNDENKKDISRKVERFIDIFFKKKLNNKITIKMNGIYSLYQNIISAIFEEFQNEFYEEEDKKFIKELFYCQSYQNCFTTLYINLEEYIGNETIIKLEKVMNLHQFKECYKITKFPKVLIIIINCPYLNFLSVPDELNIISENKKYNLLGCIRSTNNSFVSIIKYINNNTYDFLQIYYDDNYYYKIETIQNSEELKNNSFVYFYSQDNNNKWQNINNNYFNYNYNNNFFLNY